MFIDVQVKWNRPVAAVHRCLYRPVQGRCFCSSNSNSHRRRRCQWQQRWAAVTAAIMLRTTVVRRRWRQRWWSTAQPVLIHHRHRRRSRSSIITTSSTITTSTIISLSSTCIKARPPHCIITRHTARSRPRWTCTTTLVHRFRYPRHTHPHTNKRSTASNNSRTTTSTGIIHRLYLRTIRLALHPLRRPSLPPMDCNNNYCEHFARAKYLH